MLARTTSTREIESGVKRKQWENWIGSNSAETPGLLAVMCTAPFSKVIRARTAGASFCVKSIAANASDSNNAGFEPIRSNNCDGLIGLDTFRGEKLARLGSSIS